MQQFVHRKNIEKYRELLASPELDETTRKQVAKLLADEEAKDPPPPKALADD